MTTQDKKPRPCEHCDWRTDATQAVPHISGFTMQLCDKHAAEWRAARPEETARLEAGEPHTAVIADLHRRDGITPCDCDACTAPYEAVRLMETQDEMFTCSECGTDHNELTRFPGKRCLDCYSRFMEGKPLERPDFSNVLNTKRGRK
jgi:DNA-directed RNA polymerase subunit RPC12/RpoP